MTDRTMREKAEKLAAINAQVAALQAQADTLKASITAEMESRAVDVLKAGSVLVRWQSVTTARFDSKRFKEAHSALYAQYIKPSTTRRFTLVPA